MLVSDITKYLESIAPLSYQESYDNSGLIVGDFNMELTGVLICLDSTEEIVEEAIENGCNLIIAHHPIIFGGLKKLNGKNYVERVVIKAIKYDIAIYAIHTNLDNVLKSGVNSKIAEKLSLNNCQILSPKKGVLKKLFTYVPFNYAEKLKNALFKAGAGHIGNYSECSFSHEGIGTFKGSEQSNPFVGEKGERHQEREVKIEVVFQSFLENAILKTLKTAHPYEEVAYEVISLDNFNQEIGSGLLGELSEEISAEEFLKNLKSKMNAELVRHTPLHKEKVKKIAVCGGSGSFLLKSAISLSADVFVSSDFKYHEFFDAEKRIIIADIGHFESEQFTIELIYEILSQNFSNFAIRQSKLITNPISYL